MNDEIRIIIVTHKKSDMPSDILYLPLQVGMSNNSEELDLGYQKDNTGDNISNLNKYLGTQTGLYWAWKNLKYKYIGLVHYRRFFTKSIVNGKGDMSEAAITYDQIKPLIGKYKIFVPKKRWYIIETLESHYNHVHGCNHMQIVREVVKEKTPEYVPALEKVFKRRWGYMFNMMILEKELLNDYCSWLFLVLFEVMNRIDIENLSEFDQRFGGRISERLFNVWLENKINSGRVTKKQIKELSYREDVNWGFKIISFLKAKFLKIKYTRSS